MVLSQQQTRWAVFLVLVVWIVGVRWHLRHEPLETDIATYAVIGREMLAGRVLYADLWDHKPPGIHLVFAASTALVGSGTPAVLLVNVGFSIAIFGCLILAGRRLSGDLGAVIAGFLWAFVGMDLGLQANQPNVELPMNLCVAMALAMSLGGRPRISGRAFGALTAIAVLFKPVALAQFGLLAVVEVVERWRRGGNRAGLIFSSACLATTLLLLIVVMSWCVTRAGFGPVWGAVVRFNISYTSGTVLENLVELTRVGFHLLPSSTVIIAILGLSAIAGLRVIEVPNRRRILAIMAGSAIAVMAPGKFYPHYYQLFLPPLVIAASAGLAHGIGRKGIRRSASLGMLVALVCVEAQSVRLPPDEWSRRKYGETFLEERQIAAAIETRVETGEPFWQLGAWPGLYLLTETTPASGILYWGPFHIESPVRESLVRRTIADLSQSKPRFIVVRKVRDDHRLVGWIAENYRALPVEMPAHRTSLFVRRERPLFVQPESRVFSDDFEGGEDSMWRIFGGSQKPAR